uniref:Phosphate regulon sensor protein PhoR n=1 Tax=Candidatus Kentrum eta TaxID=2126337 RepID=A0A450UZY5_9GAMM|nr:MAG: two-component system, OmpR family, phosphate regulon sensor histidine kinase PhoR [Candidatus Kentron sp. H]VFJ91419.1 MAG: two-component system, OmpR family, phosphate regulon sensor histidine kinase PhoR [Candidatus Kentron sp. H]VFJ98117.1 MAG: two-component system, OmpR family, phosphate regulon sensor histidine kinase PhoR [Candidatus Kentron sp. H]
MVIWRNGLFREAVLISSGAIAIVFLGLGFWDLGLERVMAFMGVAALAYLAWHLVQLYRLRSWLRDPKTTIPSGTPPRFVGIWREVLTDIEDRLRASRIQSGPKRKPKRKPKLDWVVKRFNKSVSGLSDAAVLFGNDGKIEWWNAEAGRLLGIGRTDDRGRQIAHLIPYPAFIQRLRAQRHWRQPLEAPSPVDPGLWLTMWVVPAGKSRRLLQARDATRLHRLEQIRRDFVANVSHELRTPLTVINGYVETLLDRDDVKTLPWYPVLPKIHGQAERMGKIVEDLLLLSGLELARERPRREHVAVAAMLETIREEALALSTGHHIDIDANAGLGIIGDARELRSAFSNLVFNAVRYTTPGGRITVRWRRDDEGGHLLVRDTGVGIEAEHLPRITERFYRVDTARSRETGGTGLGLTIVKHVLTQHNARLSIESTPGKGSDFTCHFPPARLFEN